MVDILDDGKTGFFIPPKDSASLSEKVNLFLSDAELRLDVGKAAKEKSQEYDLKNNVTALESLYLSILGNNNSHFSG